MTQTGILDFLHSGIQLADGHAEIPFLFTKDNSQRLSKGVFVDHDAFEVEKLLLFRTFNSMSITFYNILHILGAFMVMLAYGGLIVRSALEQDSPNVRRLGAITSGIGLLLIFVSGFGLLAKYGYGWPTWVLLKIVIWLVLGGLIVLINRQPKMAQALWWSTLLLGAVAAVLAIAKPI